MTGEPRPGDFGVVAIRGATGRLIRIGQWLNGDGYRNYQHAFIVVDGGRVVEAEPGGARITPLTSYKATNAVYSDWPLTDQQRHSINIAALASIGTPYSILDYLSLALHRFHIRPPGLKRFIANTGHLICSQLVDYCYEQAGVHLFNDGRWAGDVTPGDLTDVLHGPKETQ